MATQVDPPNGVKNQGKHYFSMWQTLFEIDAEYVSITPIGRGASGVVCSSVNKETDERVAINKIHNVFELLRGLKYIHSANFLHRDLKPALICFRRCSFLTHPSKRISVTEALQHPYLAPLYDPSSNPPAEVPIDLDVDVDEDEDLGALL
ncbi:hypothetical protein F2Q70_00001800 [Brassica cretica]|uniref:Protein kinase domain-containing protein n=1 Tax=Brassica cretica TaxID=69181 RepID=A0A8S9IRP1_BRACR|nr:hypothetical protein F2Q70_00001800 [Brassica cretica]KAF3563221.1 hypothetical protein DY000_02012950 [Brassica cretica]